MRLGDLYPSSYLKSEDLKGRTLTYTIDRVFMADMNDGKQKPILKFSEDGTEMVLNRTNGETLAASFGDDTRDWEGRRVEVYTERVMFQGKRVDGLRLRPADRGGRSRDDDRGRRDDRDDRRDTRGRDDDRDRDRDRDRDDDRRRDDGGRDDRGRVEVSSGRYPDKRKDEDSGRFQSRKLDDEIPF